MGEIIQAESRAAGADLIARLIFNAGDRSVEGCADVDLFQDGLSRIDAGFCHRDVVWIGTIPQALPFSLGILQLGFQQGDLSRAGSVLLALPR